MQVLPLSQTYTCEVVKSILLEDFIHQRKELPHLWRHLLASEAVSQRQDLLIKLWDKKKKKRGRGKTLVVNRLFIINSSSLSQPHTGGIWLHRNNWSSLPSTCCCSTVPITCRQMPSSCWVIWNSMVIKRQLGCNQYRQLNEKIRLL